MHSGSIAERTPHASNRGSALARGGGVPSHTPFGAQNSQVLFESYDISKNIGELLLRDIVTGRPAAAALGRSALAWDRTSTQRCRMSVG